MLNDIKRIYRRVIGAPLSIEDALWAFVIACAVAGSVRALLTYLAFGVH